MFKTAALILFCIFSSGIAVMDIKTGSVPRVAQEGERSSVKAAPIPRPRAAFSDGLLPLPAKPAASSSPLQRVHVWSSPSLSVVKDFPLKS
jgi:hypothetical protein